MATFFYILIGLLLLNAVLLTFSVNGVMESLKRPLRKLVEPRVRVPEFFDRNLPETGFKKAV